MDTAITINSILAIFGIIVAVVAGCGAIYKIIKFINDWHDKIQKYDGYQDQINMAHNYAQEELNNMKNDMIEKIELTNAETTAKMQQLMTEQYILTKSMLAVLEGLKQQGCNGPVTKAKEELEKYLVQQAHDGI